MTTMSPDSQCLPDHPRQAPAGPRSCERRACRRSRRRTARPDVVAHPAVDGDVEPARSSVQRDRLDRADLVQRERRRAGDGPARLDRQARDVDAERPALVRDDRADPVGQRRRGRRGRPGSCRRCRSRRRGRARSASSRARGPLRTGPAPVARPPRSRTCRRSASRCGSAGRPARASRWAAISLHRRERRRPRRSRTRTSGPRVRSRCTRACVPRRPR